MTPATAAPARVTTGPTAPDPRIGVVVLTHNRADELARTLDRLHALPEQPAIVVVDNASRDDTPALVARRFPDVRYLRLATNAGAAGRNAGVRACPRPYVALCDDDTWWEAGALGRAADLLDAHPRIAVLSGRVLVGEENRLDPTCLIMAGSPLPAAPQQPGPSLLGFLAGAAVVRRSAFLAAGGFEPRLFLGGEERLLALDLVRRGWSLHYRADLVVHHHPSPLRDSAARRRLLIRNELWTCWLRRSPRTAWARTLAVVRHAGRDPVARAALIEALRGLPWAVRHRRPVPPAIEAALHLIERMTPE